MNLLLLCLGLLDITCSTPIQPVPLTAADVSIPHELTLTQSTGRRNVTVTISGAQFAEEPTVTEGSLAGFGPNAFVIITDAGVKASDLKLDVSGSNIGDLIKISVRVGDPNASVIITEKTYTVASVRGVERFTVPFFNPATNRTQETFLRLSATGGDVVATITGIDDAGNQSTKAEYLLEAGKSIQLTAVDLEARMGTPVGKRRLTIDADATGLVVQGMVRNSTTGVISAITDTVKSE